MNDVVAPIPFHEALYRIKSDDTAMRCLGWDKCSFVSMTPENTISADKFWSKWNRAQAEKLGGELKVVESLTKYEHGVGVAMGWTPSTMDMSDIWVDHDVRLLPTALKLDVNTSASIRYELIKSEQPSYVFSRIHDLIHNEHREVVYLTNGVSESSVAAKIIEMLIGTTKDLIDFAGVVETVVHTGTDIYSELTNIGEVKTLSPHDATVTFKEVLLFVDKHYGGLVGEDLLFIIDGDSIIDADILKSMLDGDGYASEVISVKSLL